MHGFYSGNTQGQSFSEYIFEREKNANAVLDPCFAYPVLFSKYSSALVIFSATCRLASLDKRHSVCR
jgi:hypothetical protein